MAVTTYLRLLRLKHGISLQELAARADVSWQHISRLELCQSAPTQRQEKQLSTALEALIKDRSRALEEMEHDLALCKNRLLQETEETEHGL